MERAQNVRREPFRHARFGFGQRQLSNQLEAAATLIEHAPGAKRTYKTWATEAAPTVESLFATTHQLRHGACAGSFPTGKLARM
jgi:hypothetical protein